MIAIMIMIIVIVIVIKRHANFRWGIENAFSGVKVSNIFVVDFCLCLLRCLLDVYTREM